VKIGALAPWFGSKRTLAPKIVEAIGPHRAYWEPFCGSMAVLLAKPKCRMETVSDLHGDLINLARVVRDEDAGRELYRQARLVLCGDDELAAANRLMRSAPAGDQLDVGRALAYLAASWMGRNGEAGLRESKTNSRLCVRWGNNGGAPGTRWAGVVRSIAAWRRRLAGVTVLRRCGFEVLSKIADEPDAVIYCDPPYLLKSDTYEHDFAEADHRRLAESLRRFRRARAVVSYYDHPALADLYPGWQVIDCSRVKALGNLSPLKPAGGTSVAPEVLLVNDRRGGLFA
jgi:DNA adenine methylase